MKPGPGCRSHVDAGRVRSARRWRGWPASRPGGPLVYRSHDPRLQGGWPIARTYRPSLVWRLFSLLVRGLLRLGLFPKGSYLLTVRGRRTGRPHSTPVTLIEEDRQRWLVAPYGVVDWVRNARAAGQVTLSRGRHAEAVRIAELDPEQSAPILKLYVARVPHTQPYFDATPASPLEVVVAEAPRHPVFRIVDPAAEGVVREL